MRFEAIQIGNNRLEQNQVNIAGGIEQTNRVPRCSLVLFLLYSALRCHKGEQDSSY